MTWEHAIEAVERLGLPVVLTLVLVYSIGRAIKVFYTTFLSPLFTLFIQNLAESVRINEINAKSLVVLADSHRAQTKIMETLAEKTKDIAVQTETHSRIDGKLDKILALVEAVKKAKHDG